MTVLLTGAAGFIGSHVAQTLLARGERVIGIDNFSTYYDPVLKFARLKPLRENPAFTFFEADVSDREAILNMGEGQGIDRIVHLAAQPGVRHSLVDPYIYVQTNVMGHLVMLELARRLPDLKHFVYASSSSVYGGNRKLPFAIADRVDHPVSLYAATKRSDELMTEAYCHQFGMKATGLRYFTVYGPREKPSKLIQVLLRLPARVKLSAGVHDYVFISDFVTAVFTVLDSCTKLFDLVNIGSGLQTSNADVVRMVELLSGHAFEVEAVPGKPYDSDSWVCDTAYARAEYGITASVPLERGLAMLLSLTSEEKKEGDLQGPS